MRDTESERVSERESKKVTESGRERGEREEREREERARGRDREREHVFVVLSTEVIHTYI